MLQVGEKFVVLGLQEGLALASLLNPIRIPVTLRHAATGVAVACHCIPLAMANKGGDVAAFSGRIITATGEFCFRGTWNAGSGFKKIRISAELSEEEMKDERDDALVI